MIAGRSDDRRGKKGMIDHDAVSERALIAYFSMEVALDNHIPTYSGGLGVLAGDTLRSAADLGLPMVGVTLLYRKGYFFQRLDPRAVSTKSQWHGRWMTCSSPQRAPAPSSWRAGR
jgi:glucan phosphorylase